ncbi:uncharacterized protein A4U43_C01F28370 [Asparagus officinalis]|uniref:Uncharacterized protein n=1 Tax=Asparagus officinalis TaxID=4686 RepID=A0A5P1FST4_ASPOF|nr:uncharacterized protein A4U43_C01F28370 [Asparagus officinalis]
MSVLDYVLVPLGLGVMAGYQGWLLYMVMKHPTKTVIGINSINRRAWVNTMMEESNLNPTNTIFSNIPYSGSIKKWNSCSPNAKEQHNGINSTSVHSNHAMFTSSHAHDSISSRPKHHHYFKHKHKLLPQVIPHIGMLPHCIPDERPIHKILQSCKHFDQREEIPAPDA